MDLRQAYVTLGLARGATTEEIEAAHERLRNDLEARLDRVSAAPVHARFHELRTRLDAARDMLLALPRPGGDEPLADAFSLLGLRPGASALDVASAYVSLCDEIEREAGDAPTEELRRACLEARADVDAAYQQCALSPLRGELEPQSVGGAEPARYETQMSTAPFEASSEPQALRIEPEREAEAPQAVVRRRRRRGLVRNLAAAASLMLVVAGAGFSAGWWLGLDWAAELGRYAPSALVERFAPSAPQAELAEARSTAEYLRRRINDERRDLASRIEESTARVQELQRAAASALDPVERERIGLELSRARARRDLSVELAELSERHVLSGPDLAVAYGKIELGTELVTGGQGAEALAAFAEARTRLEATLRQLDLAERAVGARSEAEAGLEAWQALATSAELDELPSAKQGLDLLQQARRMLSEGRFEESTPDLRRAAQQFSAAVAEGRRLVAALRAAEAERLAEEGPVSGAESPEATATGESPAAAEAGASQVLAAVTEPGVSEALAAVTDPAEEEASASEVADAEPEISEPPPVAAAPPDHERAAIKLVLVPAGEFFYGCNTDVDPTCAEAEEQGRRLALAAFQIDRTEVRTEEYRACVDAAACTLPATERGCNWEDPARADHPMNCVDWRQANAYCAWVGKRLPSEREWEKAARGTDGRSFPWGNTVATCDQAVIAEGELPGCGRDSTWPVGSRAEGRSPFGLFDMAGNVYEWTGDSVRDGGSQRIVRGGSWRGESWSARSWSRVAFTAESRDPRIGFRCAQDDALFAASSTR
jgi:formylglycine-generating enzyme required for sulfatase activity